MAVEETHVSLTYSLYIDASAEHVRSAILSAHAVHHLEGELILDSGLRFIVDEIPTGEWTVAEDVGITPRSAVRFFLDQSQGLSAQQLNPASNRLGPARRGTGDAVLLFNGEHVWLLRTNQLTLNSSLWNENRLAIVSEPYEMRVIPSI